ncbi:MAG: metal-dependent hydrolase [Acidobacteriota bacterium]|nr:metal-dependent hydrolase [Acidobacteriota bacterium]
MELTWIGHGSFRFDTKDGTRVYVDPFLTHNPKCPDAEKEPERVDVIAVTHGHMDHIANVADLAKKHGATVIAMIEIGDWLASKHGVDESKLQCGNKGGATEAGGVRFTLVGAQHSSGLPDGSYGGEAAGIVAEADGKAVYFAGDTDVFGDMALIGRLYAPDLAVLPIGDFFTMGPKQAALALELLGTKRCLPCHYGTFPPLVGTPAELKKLAPNVTVEDIEPGQSITV